jgi:membrane fusion protein, copper/silver efflux system
MTTPAKFTAGLFLATGIFFAGYVANRPPAPVAAADSARRVLYYTCPMHPQYRSDHSGTAPCCGMQLVPVFAGDAAGQFAPAAAGTSGTVRISAAKRQLIGVRTDEVRRAPSSHLVRVFGRVAVDEGRSYRIIAAADGWIRELGANPAGTFVKQNDILASYYTRDLLAAQQTFLYALVTNAQAEPKDPTTGPQRPPTNLSFQVAIDTLRNLGMSERQIDELRKTHTAANLIHFYAPATGFVIARSVSPQQRFDKGTEVFRIADLSHVWIMADIFEKDREFVKPGAVVTVRYQGRQFTARMSDSLPQFDAQSRTLKTRFELDNPGAFLRPDMFVDVEMQVKMPAAVTVAAEALLDSGRTKTVFVDREGGVYEPRRVETGWRLGDRVQILKGLEPGERVVVSGNFLLDSESRMNVAQVAAPPAVAAPAAAGKDPVCGMEVDTKSPGAIKLQAGARIHYFCSEKCKKDFETDPAKYLPKSLAVENTAAKRT